MGRVYPPLWCEIGNCSECNSDACNKRILTLFEPYIDTETPFHKRPKQVEVTTISIYLGFCQLLAKYCLMFPQHSLPVVRSNFINSTTGFPTNQSIQRIFLDMLDRGDPNAPTDEVHKYRMLFFSHDLYLRKRGFKIVSEEGEQTIRFSDNEIRNFSTVVRKWRKEFESGRLRYKRTSNPLRCQYCFLENCQKYT